MSNRKHDNLISGFGGLDSSRPLDYFDPINSPRVYGRPTNIRDIVSWRGRIKAAWLVLTLNAVAVRWYDEKNVHLYGRTWHEQHINRYSGQADFSGSLNVGYEAIRSGEGAGHPNWTIGRRE